MKIIYIAHCRFPSEKAHSLQIAKMCEAFRGQGVELELVVPKKHRQIKETATKFFNLKEKFVVTYLWTIDWFSASTFGFLLSAFIFGWSTFFYLWRQRDFDLIYSIDLDPWSFVGALFLGRPCFFEMHGPKKPTILNRLLFKKAQGVFAINESIKQNLLANFSTLKPEQVLISPNGVDLSLVQISRTVARQKLGLTPDIPIVVYTGSFQTWKGVETIIEAARGLNLVNFYLVGGTEAEALTLSNHQPLPINLHCLGIRPHQEMPWWQAAADVLLVTGTKKDQYSYYHTSPMKLFEYLAAQRAVIASRTPAIKQIVSDQEVFFHEPDSVPGLIETINHVLTHADEVAQKISQSYRRARGYSWEQRAIKILDFINTKI